MELNEMQKMSLLEFRSFVNVEIIPYAQQYDFEGCLPIELVRKLGERGYLGALLPQEVGGLGMDMITYGLLIKEVGRGCSSVRSLMTAHNMVAQAIIRWGTKQQRIKWLPKLAKGEIIAAFALTEPNVGSDAKSIETTASLFHSFYILNGTKKWITYGQGADLFLIFAQERNKPSAFLVERDNPGLIMTPIANMLGTRASMMADLTICNCQIPQDQLLGKSGLGFSHVASTALHYGRYSVAWGCVGITEASLEASVKYTSSRLQFGQPLINQQLVRQMITNMFTSLKASMLLCSQAGHLANKHDPGAIAAASIAKYFATTAAKQAASDAVQLHGASGCDGAHPVQRYYRDAKVMEIIEGSTQIQQITIAEYALQEFGL